VLVKMRPLRWLVSSRKAATTRGVKLRSGAPLEFFDGDFGAHCFAVGAGRGHRLERVAYEHDSRGERDLLAEQVVGVAFAVHPLVR
jgi:hypothetical protein